MSKRMGYREALAWLALNDDTEWLDDADGSPSVTLALVADIYGKETEDAARDLRRMRDKVRAAQAAERAADGARLIGSAAFGAPERKA